MKTATFKTIEIIVSPTGETSLQTHGFAGRDCLEATRKLQAALGHTTAERLTAEFYAASRQTEGQLKARGENA